MNRCLALFDLDNTLLDGDSDHAWGEFLIHKGLVEENTHRAKNNQFYHDYVNERLDIDEYVAFTDSTNKETLGKSGELYFIKNLWHLK